MVKHQSDGQRKKEIKIWYLLSSPINNNNSIICRFSFRQTCTFLHLVSKKILLRQPFSCSHDQRDQRRMRGIRDRFSLYCSDGDILYAYWIFFLSQAVNPIFMFTPPFSFTEISQARRRREQETRSDTKKEYIDCLCPTVSVPPMELMKFLSNSRFL